MFVYGPRTGIQTVRAGGALGWRRQLHDAEPVVLLVDVITEMNSFW
jgi:hypothetical protein